MNVKHRILPILKTNVLVLVAGCVITSMLALEYLTSTLRSKADIFMADKAEGQSNNLRQWTPSNITLPFIDSVDPFSIPDFCNNLPYSVDQPRTILMDRNKNPADPIVIFLWRQQVFLQGTIDWKEHTDMCPFAPELQAFFDEYYNVHVEDKSIVWPIGFAPCWLWSLNEEAEHTTIRTECSNHDFVLTTNYTEFRQADIIYMEYAFFQKTHEPPFWNINLMPPRLAHQRWVFKYDRESVGYYPFVALPSFLQGFDFTFGAPGQLFDKPYPLEEITHELALELANVAPSVPLDQEPQDYLAWIISNCAPLNNRNELMTELIEKIGAHSYGKCQNNKAIPQELEEEYKDKDPETRYALIKHQILRNYPFTLAVENSNCLSYVTEKIYHALSVGAIPIYEGASDIDDFVPKGSIIRVQDFATTDDLVQFLKTVDRSQYYTWKNDVKADVSKFCKHCLKPRLPIECLIVDNVEFAPTIKHSRGSWQWGVPWWFLITLLAVMALFGRRMLSRAQLHTSAQSIEK